MGFLKKQSAIFVLELINRYFDDEIGNMSASLAYYLIFSFFPTIVFASSMLGHINISSETVIHALGGILPADILGIIDSYLVYLQGNSSTNILMVSMFFTMYFPVRAMSRVMDGINTAYGTESTRSIVVKVILMMIFAVVFILSIIAIFILLLVGRNVIGVVSYVLGIHVPTEFIEFWGIIRFLAMAIIGLVSLTLIYWIVPECEVKLKDALPGALFAVSGWVILSAGFSFYVENMGKYSILFGSLGAIMVLLIWLYLMSAVILLGAEVNSILKSIKYKN